MIEESLESFKMNSDYLKRIKTEHLMSKNVKKCSVSKCTYEGERGLFEIPKDDRRNIWLELMGTDQNGVVFNEPPSAPTLKQQRQMF